MPQRNYAVRQLKYFMKDFGKVKWEDLKKNKSWRSERLIANEKALMDSFGTMFDISHQSALSFIIVEEDKTSILLQQEENTCHIIAGVDKNRSVKEINKKEE